MTLPRPIEAAINALARWIFRCCSWRQRKANAITHEYEREVF